MQSRKNNYYLDVFVVVAVIGFALVIVYSFLSILMVPPNIADVLRVQMPGDLRMVKDRQDLVRSFSRFSYQSLPAFNRTINGLVVYIWRGAARRSRQYNYRGTSRADRPLLRGAPDKARAAHCSPHRACGLNLDRRSSLKCAPNEFLTLASPPSVRQRCYWPSGKTRSPDVGGSHSGCPRGQGWERRQPGLLPSP